MPVSTCSLPRHSGCCPLPLSDILLACDFINSCCSRAMPASIKSSAGVLLTASVAGVAADSLRVKSILCGDCGELCYYKGSTALYREAPTRKHSTRNNAAIHVSYIYALGYARSLLCRRTDIALIGLSATASTIPLKS